MDEFNEDIETEEVNLFPIDSAIDESLVDENIDRDATKISMNENLDIEFIRKYKEKLDWKALSINHQFCETELIEFIGWIHWKTAVYCQNQCTKKFIKNNNLTSIIEDLEKHNRDFMMLNNEQYGNIENVLVIGEETREDAYMILLSRIDGRIQFHNSVFPANNNYLELVFDDNFVFHVPYTKLDEMKRDLQIEIVLTDDIIKAIRNTVEKYDVDNTMFTEQAEHVIIK